MTQPIVEAAVDPPTADPQTMPTVDAPIVPDDDPRLAEAVAAYRRVVLAADPALPAELVAGGTVAEVDASVDLARTIVARVREAVLAEAARDVPAGVSGRTPPDLASMSARDKIAFGLNGR